jgi:hypothetical protein
LRGLTRFLEHLHGGLIDVQVIERIEREQFIAQQIDERLHQFATAQHPARQGGARARKAQALELLGLAVQRQRIDGLGRGDKGQQSGAGLALGDGLRGHRRRHHVLLAARASVLAPLVVQPPNRRRHDVQLFAVHRADALQRRRADTPCRPRPSRAPRSRAATSRTRACASGACAHARALTLHRATLRAPLAKM